VTEGGDGVGVFSHVSPSGSDTDISVKSVTWISQTDLSCGSAAQVNRCAHLDQSDVMTLSMAVAAVHQDVGDTVYLRLLVMGDASGSSQNGDVGDGTNIFNTVSSSHDPSVRDQRTTADVVAVLSQGNLPWVSLNGSLFTPDNLKTAWDGRDAALAGERS